MNVILSIKNICKTVLLSVEALFAVVMFFVYQINLKVFSDLGAFLYSSNDIITFITVAAPVAIFIYSLSIQKILLQPEEVNTILIKWPEYKNYKTTIIVGIVFCALPIFPSIMSWMNKDIYKIYDIGFYYVLLLGISIISVVSLYFAQYKVKEILDLYKES